MPRGGNNRREWTAEEEAQLRRLLAEGRGYHAVGLVLHRGGETVRRKAESLGLNDGKAPTAARAWSAKDSDLLYSLVERGVARPAIAKRLRRTEEAVRRRMTILKLSYRHSAGALSALAVMRLLGTPGANLQYTVTRWVQEYGLPAANPRTGGTGGYHIQWLDLVEWLEQPEHWMLYDPMLVTELALREHLLEIRVGQPRWLTCADVAAQRHVVEDTVVTWCRRGRLAALWRKRMWWVREDVAQAFVLPSDRRKRDA
jgi:hypothetical protein